MTAIASAPALQAEELQRGAADPTASVWVSASAGTGKTKVLVDRVLSLLLADPRPQRILCLTFTRAAAAEMATRIADQLGRWTLLPDGDLSTELDRLTGTPPDEATIRLARQLFATVLETPGGMNIQTIHAFCQSLLRRFPLEAGIAPHFSLMDERDTQELLVSAREEVLSQAREGRDEGLAAALAVVTAQIHEMAFTDLLSDLTSSRGRLRRLFAAAGGIDALIDRTYSLLRIATGETAEQIIEAACHADVFDELGLRLATEALEGGTKTDVERAQILRRWLTVDQAARQQMFHDYLSVYLTQSYKAGEINIRKTLITKKAAESAPGAMEILENEAERLARTLIAMRRAAVAAGTAALLTLGDSLLTVYQARKAQHALFDYDDLILEAAELLNAPGIAPWVLFKLDGGIDHVLIDEAQDTSPEQWRVIQALTGEYFAGEGTHEAPRTVFAVGDVKQSIYSFQGADPESFGEMRERFAEIVPAAQGRWRAVDLNISFRSIPPILRAVDAVFAPPEVRDGVSLDGEEIEHSAERAGAGGLVEIWPPVVPRPLEAPAPWMPPVERIYGDSTSSRLAQLMARRIHQMIDGREILESKGRPIEAGDIMILVRRRVGFVEELVRALKNLEINVAGVDRMILIENLAVMDLVALGRFLLLPEDDLNLATVLKGPLIGLTEEQLFDLAYGREGFLWDELARRTGEGAHFAGAHAELSALLARADFVPPFELYAEILGARRGREKLLSRLGPDAADPIAEFLSLALSYEKTHIPSLEGFLYWVETGAVEVKRDLEQGTPNAVRVMTVHGAKGLQAPIVFLPDTMGVPTQGPRLLWKQEPGGEDEAVLWAPRRGLYEETCEAVRADYDLDRDREYRRLLYVAMTRAEDRLYVCGWQTQRTPPEGCWYNLILDGLEGMAETVDEPFLSQAEEIDDSTLLRLFAPQTSDVASPEDHTEEAYEDLPSWALQKAPEEPAPPRPLAPSRPTEEDPPATSPLTGGDEHRFKRGRLVHALLQTLPDMASDQRAAAVGRYLAQPGHGLSAEEQTEIAAETTAILNDSTFAPLFGPDSQAEVPIIGTIGEAVISGQLDRLVVSDDRVLIVDYKTNRDPPATENEVPEAYLRQLAAYRSVLSELFPDRPIDCALLWTMAPHLMAIDGGLLNGFEP